MAATLPISRLYGSGLQKSRSESPADRHSDVVTPLDFGATGDGVTNDTTAVLAAANHAFDNGVPLDGGELDYGIVGSLRLTSKARPWIKRLRLKQLSLGASDTQMLHLVNCQQVRVDSLYIHTGADMAAGDLERNATGFRIDGGSGHRIDNVDVTGNGRLTYVRFVDCAASHFANIHVHDGEFRVTQVAPEGVNVIDDVVDGIRLADCSSCTLDNPIVENLLGNASYFTHSGLVLKARSVDYRASAVKQFRNMRTRGIVGGGNDNCTIINPQIENVDQGFDFSGNGGGYGNKKILVQGGRSLNCASVGLKLGGAAVDCKVIGHTSENCGMYGYIVGGSNRLFKTSGVELIGCTSINAGYNDIHEDIGDVGSANYIPAAMAGFLIYAPIAAGIEDVRIINCKAVDKQGLYLLGDDPFTVGGPEPMWPGPGATAATLQFPWTGYSGSHEVVFDTSDYTNLENPIARSERRIVTLTNGSTRMTWDGGLQHKIGSPFVARPPLMRYGFLSVDETGAALPQARGNGAVVSLVNCESIGHTVAERFGGL